VAELVQDPVNQVRYAFQHDSENLIVDCLIGPGGALPSHRHPRQVERWSVLDGQVRLRLAHQERLVDPADGEMVVTPGTIHGLANVSGREVRLRCRVEPALRLQAFPGRKCRGRTGRPVHFPRAAPRPERGTLGG
jgi:quercetin dioxygenase-like cupin family protein